jgi:hypothetical protein
MKEFTKKKYYHSKMKNYWSIETTCDLRTVLFWVITLRVVVIPVLRVQESSRMGPIGCPEMSVRNYHYSLRNNPEERSSRLLRGGILKSRNM